MRINGRQRDAAAAHWRVLKHMLPYAALFWGALVALVQADWLPLPAKAGDLDRMVMDHEEHEELLMHDGASTAIQGNRTRIQQLRSEVGTAAAQTKAELEAQRELLQRIDRTVNLLLTRELGVSPR